MNRLNTMIVLAGPFPSENTEIGLNICKIQKEIASPTLRDCVRGRAAPVSFYWGNLQY